MRTSSVTLAPASSLYRYLDFCRLLATHLPAVFRLVIASLYPSSYRLSDIHTISIDPFAVVCLYHIVCAYAFMDSVSGSVVLADLS